MARVLWLYCMRLASSGVGGVRWVRLAFGRHPMHPPTPDDASRNQNIHKTPTQLPTYNNASRTRRTPPTPDDASRMQHSHKTRATSPGPGSIVFYYIIIYNYYYILYIYIILVLVCCIYIIIIHHIIYIANILRIHALPQSQSFVSSIVQASRPRGISIVSANCGCSPPWHYFIPLALFYSHEPHSWRAAALPGAPLHYQSPNGGRGVSTGVQARPRPANVASRSAASWTALMVSL